jgi:hypothetical protein
MRGLRAIVLAGVVALATMGAAAQQAAAVTSFSGECELRAYSHFFPNRAIVPVPSGFWMSDMGHCAGTLNGKPFDGQVHQYFYANMKTPMGCPAGYSTGAGPMYVTFLTDPKSFNTGAPPPTPRFRARKQKMSSKGDSYSRGKTGRKHSGRRAAKQHRAGKPHAEKAHASAKRSAAGLPGEPPPAPPPDAPPRPAPGNNPVMAVWVDEAHVMKGLFGRYYGAYRGEAIGITQFEQEPDALLQCANGGLSGSWVNGRMKTVTELRG